jgi:DNA-binding transcriptional regulator YbjK
VATNGTNGGRRPRGASDPDRRERIARAAITVVGERGVEGLTHRAVAASADVPLGSTTYHFTSRDDLLEVALDTAAHDNVQRLRDWEAGLPADADLAVALTDLVMNSLSADERPQTVVEYELYVAALHRAHLRAASSAWDAALTEFFASRTDPVTGRLLAATYCGLVMQALLADPPPDRTEVEALFRRAMAGSAFDHVEG